MNLTPEHSSLLLPEWIDDEACRLLRQSTAPPEPRAVLEAVVARHFPQGVPEAFFDKWLGVAEHYLKALAPVVRARDEMDRCRAALEREVAEGRTPSEALGEAGKRAADRLERAAATLARNAKQGPQRPAR